MTRHPASNSHMHLCRGWHMVLKSQWRLAIAAATRCAMQHILHRHKCDADVAGMLLLAWLLAVLLCH